jgi:hypothetical protein
MKKFVFLYVGMDKSPGAREKWIAWFSENGASFLDSGNPLAAGRLVTAKGGSPLDSVVAGYSLVLADDLASAEAIAATSPAPGGVQVFEALPM